MLQNTNLRDSLPTVIKSSILPWLLAVVGWSTFSHQLLPLLGGWNLPWWVFFIFWGVFWGVLFVVPPVTKIAQRNSWLANGWWWALVGAWVLALVMLFRWEPERCAAPLSSAGPSAAPAPSAAPYPPPFGCSNRLVVLLPATPTPTLTTLDQFTATITPSIAGRRVLVVRARGPLDWLRPGDAVELLLSEEPDSSIDAIVLRVDAPDAAGLIPLVVAVSPDSDQQQRLASTAVVYPRYQLPSP